MVSFASPNYKMLVEVAKNPTDEVALFSIDTGMTGSPFQEGFFDMNEDHLEGKLKTMYWHRESRKNVTFKTLTIEPFADKDSTARSSDEL